MPALLNARLRDYAYYATGGTCDICYAPATIEELAATVTAIRQDGRRFFLLGGGTNSLVSDEHFPGAVILFHKLDRVEVKNNGVVIVGAGVENSRLARIALTHGLSGAAWMYRLPGQMGGTVRMNARCYGGEISQIVKSVTVVTSAGRIRKYTISGDNSVFRGYKDTLFMDNADLVAEVELNLQQGELPAAIEAQMLFCENDRKRKGQFDFPSCGCVFKNNYAVGVSSGMLLEQAGAKSLRQGDAVVSPHHANFVFNQRHATSRDILELSFQMQDAVYAMFGVWLEYEMELLGDVPADLRQRFTLRKNSRLDEARLAPLRARMVQS